jgi:hypothetical protein
MIVNSSSNCIPPHNDENENGSSSFDDACSTDSENWTANVNNYSLTPTQLLSLAIRKRRQLIEDKNRDFRRELLHTSVIQELCKYLGTNRAKARRQRRPRRRHLKRRWSDKGYEQVVPDSSRCFSPLDQFGYDSAVQESSNGDDGRQHGCHEHGHCSGLNPDAYFGSVQFNDLGSEPGFEISDNSKGDDILNKFLLANLNTFIQRNETQPQTQSMML